MIKFSSTIATIEKDAKHFLELVQENRIFAFEAPMGAGKTTLIKNILENLGIEQFEGSPTYGFVNSYETIENGTIFHLDLYRLTSEEEAYDIGIEEIIYDNQYCFIEWPQIIRNLLPSNTVWVTIEQENNNSRTICIDV